MGTGAGNGWGKSKFVIALLTAILWPDLAPDQFTKHDLIRNWPHPKRARIISTPKEVEEIGSLQTAIAELFPRNRYEFKSKAKHYPSQFKTDTNWIIDVMTYEQDKGEFAGPDIGLTIFNEPMPEEIWKESLIRARAGGVILFAMTSLLENPWVVDGILNRADGKDIRVRYGSSEENCRQHGINGHLDHDQITKILDQYDPDEREARLTGKPLSMSGRIFKQFDRNVHVLDVEEPELVTRIHVVDPAVGKPFFCIWAWADEAGYVHVYDESPSVAFAGAKDPNMTVDDYITQWQLREAGRAVHRRVIDRRFAGQKRSLGGQTLKGEFAERGVRFQDSYSLQNEIGEVETGILKIKEFLRYNTEKKLDSINRPRLTISPKCKNLIASFERWARDPDTGKYVDDDFKDGIDDMRYLLMLDPKYQPKSTWTPSSESGYGV